MSWYPVVFAYVNILLHRLYWLNFEKPLFSVHPHSLTSCHLLIFIFSGFFFVLFFCSPVSETAVYRMVGLWIVLHHVLNSWLQFSSECYKQPNSRKFQDRRITFEVKFLVTLSSFGGGKQFWIYRDFCFFFLLFLFCVFLFTSVGQSCYFLRTTNKVYTIFLYSFYSVDLIKRCHGMH